MEKANFYYSNNSLQSLAQCVHLPDTVLAITFVAIVQVGRNQQWREGCIDDPIAVIRYDRPCFGGTALSKFWIRRS